MTEHSGRKADDSLRHRRLRRELHRFAQQMEDNLRQDGRTWLGTDPAELEIRLLDELEELRDAFRRWRSDPVPVRMVEIEREAANVANAALMLADCVHCRTTGGSHD